MPRINPHKVFLKIAKKIAQFSYAERRKVGALLVKKGNIIAYGYNGTPKGFENACETDLMEFEESSGLEPIKLPEMKTKPEVLHAESNAISKCAKSTNSSKGATLYVTLSPCFECSKMIIQAGIKKVYYSEEYRKTDGLELLTKAGIKVKQVT